MAEKKKPTAKQLAQAKSAGKTAKTGPRSPKKTVSVSKDMPGKYYEGKSGKPPREPGD